MKVRTAAGLVLVLLLISLAFDLTVLARRGQGEQALLLAVGAMQGASILLMFVLIIAYPNRGCTRSPIQVREDDLRSVLDDLRSTSSPTRTRASGQTSLGEK